MKAVQSFLGFCNFYRIFIKEYRRIARPLTKLTHKDKAFNFTIECQESFDTFHKALMSALVLNYFYYDRETQVETDASDSVIAGMLS